jgi:N-sulfoglucosamine sulfohydrolase
MRERRLDIAVEVELFDAHVGEAIALLKKHGVYENTLIVVTSDNGTDGRRSKGDTYMNNCNMPLAIMFPGRIEPSVRHDNICFSDFAPTFLELAGVDIPDTITGQSFVDVLLTPETTAPRKPMFCGRENYSNRFIYPSRSIKIGDYYFIKNHLHDKRYPEGTLEPPKQGDITTQEIPYEGSILQHILDRKKSGDPSYWNWCYEMRPREELYDLEKDPDCLHNLAGNPEYKAIKESIAAQLHEFLLKENDPRELGDKTMTHIWETDTFNR